MHYSVLSPLRFLQRSLWRFYVLTLRRYFPERARLSIRRLYGKYVMWRISPRATALLGPRYGRSSNGINVDITWNCNLRCYDCNRSCQQAPTHERMTVGQIRAFLEETRQRGLQWKIIDLIGGEPTLHPEFDEILRTVLEFRECYSPRTRVRVTTNGFGREVNAVLARIPAGVDVRNTRKSGRRQANFVPFNLAPRDLPEYAGADYRNACSVVRDCGAGLTPYGYYPCVVAGAIDRIFGFNRGRKTLPDPEDGMAEELAPFCSVCGFFRLNYTSDVDGGSRMSASWQRAYAAWQAQAPVLTRFPEC